MINSEPVSVQWFPGHMAKTRRMIKENLKFVDLVIELRDARIPYSSQNPEIEKLIGAKKRIILLNKSDMADPAATKEWIKYYEAQGLPALAADCRSGGGLRAFPPLVEKTLEEEIARRKKRGISGAVLRLMAVGVPNVGKSSFINRMASSKRAKVADRPGVTRERQWVKLQSGMELLDMPGVLWPKFEDKEVGENLALTGAVRDEIMDIEALSARLLARIAAAYPAMLQKRYGLGEEIQETGENLLEIIARKRGMLLPGGGVNTERAAVMLLDEFRGGLIGRMSLERAAVIS